jgi:spore coat protein U-like protein
MKNHGKLVRSALCISGLAALGAFLCLDAGTAEAGTNAQNLAVSATVANVCTIGTTPLAFGLYDGVVTNAVTDLDVASKVTVTCTLAGADVTLTLGEGVNKDVTSVPAAPVRRLVDGASHFLTYSIFSNPGRTANWDNVTGTPTTPTGSAVDVPIYGRVDHGQSMPAGNYTDTVVATVSF